MRQGTAAAKHYPDCATVGLRFGSFVLAYNPQIHLFITMGRLKGLSSQLTCSIHLRVVAYLLFHKMCIKQLIKVWDRGFTKSGSSRSYWLQLSCLASCIHGTFIWWEPFCELWVSIGPNGKFQAQASLLAFSESILKYSRASL